MTRINGESVERVETFESLRAGDVVWVVPCATCGARHRALLLTFDPDGDMECLDGTFEAEPSWEAVPTPACCGSEFEFAIGISHVEDEGNIYRVINPLSQPSTTTDEKIPERAR